MVTAVSRAATAAPAIESFLVASRPTPPLLRFDHVDRHRSPATTPPRWPSPSSTSTTSTPDTVLFVARHLGAGEATGAATGRRGHPRGRPSGTLGTGGGPTTIRLRLPARRSPPATELQGLLMVTRSEARRGRPTGDGAASPASRSLFAQAGHDPGARGRGWSVDRRGVTPGMVEIDLARRRRASPLRGPDTFFYRPGGRGARLLVDDDVLDGSTTGPTRRAAAVPRGVLHRAPLGTGHGLDGHALGRAPRSTMAGDVEPGWPTATPGHPARASGAPGPSFVPPDRRRGGAARGRRDGPGRGGGRPSRTVGPRPRGPWRCSEAADAGPPAADAGPPRSHRHTGSTTTAGRPAWATDLRRGGAGARPSAGDGWWAFGGAESRQVTTVRRHVREELGWPAERVSMTGYWRADG